MNYVVSNRVAKKQQMRWTHRGAHLLLQTRVQVLNDDLRKTCCPIVSRNESAGASAAKGGGIVAQTPDCSALAESPFKDKNLRAALPALQVIGKQERNADGGEER